ncbi:MAG TPA: high-affinity branched-chain amino acid ABC transporter permease LivM [Geminicoccus sp.]|jgi:branched-chain amino acid transport system permease protein|uniref:high-affinity branched-chain amino acid ABC transporter permease LivM n=1 Tax=Geminicoccus sp. TaxID=2024832 RepID=UPI002E328BB6|nr:high-affinity branched-chain amino acid ABC transporter permease LivM [Geminicoccus sp.]HEX2527245.1 high-affinity branched-chain amino acid ABC transporter permease LivM [Geminicoccus sp.]
MTGLLGGLDGRKLARHVLGAVFITFLMTSLILGLELAASQTGLTLQPRYHIVLYCVLAVALGSTAVFALTERTWHLPILVGIVIAALLLAPLLTGNLDSSLAFLLPFPVAPLNWVALLFPAFILVRAVQLARAASRPRSAGTVRRREMSTTAKRISLAFGFLLIVAAFAFPVSPLGERQLVDIMTIVLIYIMLGWGLNIVVGLAGLLDLGYVAFYAVGSYSYALLAEYFGWSFWVCLPLAGLFAASFGVILGFPVLRLRGDYLAIVTLGFGEIIRVVLINWYEFTGGPNGLGGIPRPSFFGLPFQANPPPGGGETFASFFDIPFSPYHRIAFLYYVILVLALFTNWFTIRIRKLPIGRAWEALREDEIACRALGLNPTMVKLAAFGIGAMFAGFAGSFFAARQGFISPESFVFIESAVILAIVVLGGLGSQIGIVFSAALLIGLPEFFRELEDYRMISFGLVMVLIMIWKPSGLVAHREPTIRLHRRGEGA